MNRKGWLVGQFFPDESPFRDENVEIYLKKIAKGKDVDKLHMHPQGKEYLVVMSGKAVMLVGDEQFELRKGDYIVIPSNTPDMIVEVLEDLEIFGVRCPRVPDNKVLL